MLNPPPSLPLRRRRSTPEIPATPCKPLNLSGIISSVSFLATWLSYALSRPWPKGEILTGQAIGVHPAVIWPSRDYDPKTHQLIERRTRNH
ncbi:helix-turn-helix domain-containing protein [Rahnella aceris]|uniref:helix-turn-helix domain-containing protein n=1 Tax=Rahnella sp. (strain Y9602) TaxID=2703885 RepID=UPI0020B8493B|nr:helix-turn-helix domain-containing protein [Rahnella aceris]